MPLTTYVNIKEFINLMCYILKKQKKNFLIGLVFEALQLTNTSK